MPWFKVDDSLAFNAKFVALPLAAAGLWLRAGAWCAQQLTDGRVPASIVVALGGSDDDVAALVEARLWRRVKDGFAFHDWTDYQPTADDVRAEREAARTRMRDLRNRRKGKGRPERPANEDDGGSEPVPANTDRTFTTPAVDPVPVPRPSPSHPSPAQPDPGSTSVESSRGGGSSGTREAGAPPARCGRHLEAPAAGPCGPCGDARKVHEAWVRTQEQTRRDAGPVVGGHRCPSHPAHGAGNCPECARTATPMPDTVRDELKRRRAS